MYPPRAPFNRGILAAPSAGRNSWRSCAPSGKPAICKGAGRTKVVGDGGLT